MSAPNVSDGAGPPEWAGKLNFVDAVLQTVQLNGGDANRVNITGARQAIIDLRFAIARHCPVGCAANEVGAGSEAGLCERLKAWPEVNGFAHQFDEHKKDIAAAIDAISRLADQKEAVAFIKVTQADMIDELRKDLAIITSDRNGLMAINEQHRARIAELEAEVAREKGHHDFYRGKVSDYMGAEIEWKKLTDDLRAQNQLWFDNCACDNPCNDPEPWITTRKAISKLQTELAALRSTPAPTAPVGDGALREAKHLLEVIEAHDCYSRTCDRDGEESCDCLDKAVNRFKAALAVPTGSVKEGT